MFSSADNEYDLVTELQYERGYPPTVAERIAYGDLDMRPEAIAERRKDFAPNMETFYHGGAPDINSFPGFDDRGFPRDATFVSDSKLLANTYVGQPNAMEMLGGRQRGQIYPLAVDTRDFMQTSARGQNWENMQNLDVFDPRQGIFVIDDGRPFFAKDRRSFDTDQLMEFALGEEAPGIIIDDVVDIGPNFNAARKAYRGNPDLYQDFLRLEEGSKVAAITDPTRIRSLFGAAFDPEYTGDNLLGSLAAGALGLTALMAPEESEAGVIKSFGRNLDPRFDKRVNEQLKLMENQYMIDDRGTVNPDRIALSSLEGRPIITSMADRTQAGGLLTGINDVVFESPINLQGGQGFMFENPGMVWASAQNPVNQIMAAADLFKGENPLFAPWRMAPSGGDFATMTGETMLEYAKASMTKDQKADLDEMIRGFETKGTWDKKTQRYKNKGLKVDGWKGIDDPGARELFRGLPDAVRKELMDRMDKKFRNKGGLGIGEARSAVLDPLQATALDGRIQNIGEIFRGEDIIMNSGHTSYPRGVPGQGLGYTDQDVGIFELIPDARLGEKQKLVGDPLRPTSNELRALQMKPYYGRVTEDILRGLEARGVNVNANPMATMAAITAGQELEGLMAQLPEKDTENYSYSDLLPIKRSLDPEEREGLLGGFSPAYTGVIEDMVEGLLKFKTQAEQGIYNPNAAAEFLL